MGDVRAIAIHQATLNVMASAILQGDMNVCDRYLGVPFDVATRDGIETFATRDAVRDWIRRFRAQLIVMGATSLVRSVQEAVFVDGATIRGHQTTEIRRNGDLLVAPYETVSTLVQDHGRWQIRASDSAVSKHDWPLVARDHTPAV